MAKKRIKKYTLLNMDNDQKTTLKAHQLNQRFGSPIAQRISRLEINAHEHYLNYKVTRIS